MQRDKQIEEEVRFFENINELIVSNDAKSAFKGRVFKIVIPCWARAFEDIRDVTPIEYLNVLVELSAWLTASSCISLSKHTTADEEGFLKLFIEMYVHEVEKVFRFHFNQRRAEREGKTNT